MFKTEKPLGLLFAMAEEQQGLEAYTENKKVTFIGNRRFIEGYLWSYPVVCAISGIGKVAASATVTTMITVFKVDQLILTGVAGAADDALRVGMLLLLLSSYSTI